MDFQASRRLDHHAPSNLEQIMQETIKDYPKSEVPYWCNTNKIEIMFDRLLKVDWSNLIDLCINEDASPGVPWTHFAKTNEEFKNKYFNEIVGYRS